MKKYILSFLFLGLFLAASVNAYAQINTAHVMLNDAAVSGTNATLQSGWLDITDYSMVEIFVVTGDSVSFGTSFNIEYRGGTETSLTYSPFSGADTSMVSNIGQSSNEAAGKVLRGYTANNIPGANFIRVNAVRQNYSVGTLSSLKVIAILRR